MPFKNAVYDGVFVMYNRLIDNYPLIVKPHKWKSLQDKGETANGVAIFEGGKILIVAPTEASTTLGWSSGDIKGGGTTTSDKQKALSDWDGKANTQAQVAASSAGSVTNTASYAPGFCNSYSRSNANGTGLDAGKWWLPSLGELETVFANMAKVNDVLSLISGATPLAEDAYWTSTEFNANRAWYQTFASGATSNEVKATALKRVRAVSTLA